MQTLSREQVLARMTGEVVDSGEDTIPEESLEGIQTISNESAIMKMAGLGEKKEVIAPTNPITNPPVQPTGPTLRSLYEGTKPKFLETPSKAEQTSPVPVRDTNPPEIPSLVQGTKLTIMDKVFRLFEPSWKNRVAKSQVAIENSNRTEMPPNIFEKSILDLVGAGLRESTTGIAMSQKIPQIDQVVDMMNRTDRLIYKAASLGADLPLMVASGALLGGGNPVTTTGAAFAVPAGIRKVYIDRLQKGEVKNFNEFWTRLTDSVKESLKGEAIGIATGLAAPGGLAVELGAMLGTGAVLEGHLPSSDDILEAALLLGGLKAGFKGLDKLTPKERTKVQDMTNAVEDIYASTGKPLGTIMDEVVKEATGKSVVEVSSEELVKAQEEIKSILNKQNELEIARVTSQISDDLIKEDLYRKADEVAKERTIKAGDYKNWWLQDAVKVASKAKKRAVRVKEDIQKERLKIEQTKEPLTKEQVIEEIADVAKPKEIESRDVTQVESPSIKDDLEIIRGIEEKYEKPIEEISDVEIEDYFLERQKIDWFAEEGKVERQIEDIDSGYPSAKLPEQVMTDSSLGSESPVETGELSGFRESKFKTDELAKMFEGRKIDSVDMYTAKLVNDVNRWLDGREIDIESTRSELEKLSFNADELRHNFDSGSQFSQWKDLVESASEWANKSQRIGEGKDGLKIKQTKGKRKRVVSTKLTSGFDPIDAAKAVKDLGEDIVDAALRFRRSFDKDMKAGKFVPNKAYNDFKKGSIAALIERRGNLRKTVIRSLGDEGYRAAKRMYLVAGANGLAKNKYDKLNRNVFKGLDKQKKTDLFSIIEAFRMKDIASYKSEKEFAFPEGRGPKESVSYEHALKKLRGYTDSEYKDLVDRAKAYDRHIKLVLESMHKDGIIGDQELKDLSSHYWRELKDLDTFENNLEVAGTSKAPKIEVKETGIKSLATKKEKGRFEMNAEILAVDFFNRMYKKVLENRSSKQWLKIARENPDNGLVFTKYKEPKLLDEEFKALSKEEQKSLRKELREKKVPKGFVRFIAYEGGETQARKTPFYVHPEVAKELVNSGSSDLSYRFANALGWLLLTKPLRVLATGAAPVWSTLVAFPIDILSALTSARTMKDGKYDYVYSSTSPLGLVQLGKDYLATAKDAHFRGAQYDLYAENGGLMNFLAKQYRIDTPGAEIPNTFGKIMDALTYHSDSMELWTRLAIQRRVMLKEAKASGRSLEELMKDPEVSSDASFAARDYMDFNQGGWLVKGIDHIFPYTNAAFQGNRTFFRMAKDDPGRFTYIAGQIAMASMGLTIANYLYNKDSQDGISIREKSHNRIIQLPSKFNGVDSEGNKVGLFWKIPLPPQIALLTTLFDTATEKFLFEAGVIDREPDYDGVLEAIKANIPYNLSGLPPLLGALNNYSSGKDLFTGRKTTDEILPWPLSKSETNPYETPQILEDIGQVTGLSPKRLGPALKAAFSDSIFSYAIGAGYEEVFGDVPDDVARDSFMISLSKVPGINRVLGVSRPGTRDIKDITEREYENKAKEYLNRETVDAYAKFAYWRGSSKAELELEKFIEGFKEEDYYSQEAARKKAQFIQDVAELKNRNFWLKIKNLNPERRGEEFALKFNSLSPSGQDELMEELGIASIAGGWEGERFWVRASEVME